MRFTSPEALREALEKEGCILNLDEASLVWTAIHTEPVAGAILSGPPGVGKSLLPEALSRVLNCPLVSFQVFSGMSDDTLITRHTVDEKGNVVAADGPLLELAKLSLMEEYPVVVGLVDEIDKGRNSTDHAFLNFLQTGYINYLGRKYKADLSKIIFFLTTNNERALAEPLVRRLPWIDMKPLKPELVAKLLKHKGFNEKETGLAVKLYLAGFQANLSRPITLQEIVQFLTALRLNPEVKLVRFIKAYLVKDDEELEDYLKALQNLPEKVVLGEDNLSEKEKKVRSAVGSSLVVEDKNEEEVIHAPIVYPKVDIKVKPQKRPEVKVRVLPEKEVETKTGYFLANDYIYDALNRLDIPFSVVEIRGQRCAVLRKPFNVDTLRNFIPLVKDHLCHMHGEFLYRQELYMSWEDFKNKFNIAEHLRSDRMSEGGKQVRPLMIFKNQDMIRIDYRVEDTSFADALFYNHRGEAVLEVHVKRIGKYLDAYIGTIFLTGPVLKWRDEMLKRGVGKTRREKPEVNVQEVLQSLGAKKEVINGKEVIVIPMADYLLKSDRYTKLHDDLLIYITLLHKSGRGLDDVEVRFRVYFPTCLFRNHIVSERFSDSYTGEMPVKTGCEKDNSFRYYKEVKYELRYDFGIPPSEEGLKRGLEIATAEVLKETILPFIDFTKERKRMEKAVEELNRQKEDLLIGNSQKSFRR